MLGITQQKYTANQDVFELFSLKQFDDSRCLSLTNEFDSNKSWKIFRDLGLFACCTDKTEGSQKINQRLFDLIVYLSFQLDDPAMLLAVLFQLSGVMLPLAAHDGSPEVVDDFLYSMIKGELIAAHCLTEPEAGTDSAGMKSVAEQKNQQWRIRGEKAFICNANTADIGLVYAKTKQDSKSLFSDLAAFIVNLKQPNVHIDKPLQKLGLQNIPMGNIVFDDVVSKYKVQTSGFTMLQTSTTYERIIIPLAFIGRMIRIYDICAKSCRMVPQTYGYITNMHIKAQAAIALALSVLSKINFLNWHRNYLQLGCTLKIHLTDSYLDIIRQSKKLFPYLTENQKKTITSEHKDALGAWIYSGTNDSLHSMLSKLIL